MSTRRKRPRLDPESSLVHSNYHIRWKNFRRFADTGWITVRPITVLIGPNNSGKTSVLSPLLVLNQTIASSDSEAPIVTRGRLIDIGSYKDFVHLHDDSRELFFGLKFHNHAAKSELPPVGTFPPGAMEVTFRKSDGSSKLVLKEYAISDFCGRPYLTRRLQADGRYSLTGVVPLDKMTDRERTAVLDTTPVNFLFAPTATLHAMENAGGADRSVSSERFSEAFSHYLRAVGFAFTELRSVFRDLSYVGPLRTRIRRYYRAAGESPSTVGPQGESAPHLFRRARKEQAQSINEWIRRFDFGDSMYCEEINDDLFKLILVNGAEKNNLADVGFGASQVLPLIIQALAAPADSLTLAEQPEIHLNPRLQGVLADLFVHMAKSGHRVLVETHSEHLLTRLRTLVATGQIEASDVAVYFVERSEGESAIRLIPIDSNGHISREAWPRGFFEDALRESLILATTQSKTRRSN